MFNKPHTLRSKSLLVKCVMQQVMRMSAWQICNVHPLRFQEYCKHGLHDSQTLQDRGDVPQHFRDSKLLAHLQAPGWY